MAEPSRSDLGALSVEAALEVVDGEVAAAYRRDRRSLSRDIEARVADSIAAQRQFSSAEAAAGARLNRRVETGPRRRLAAARAILETLLGDAPPALHDRVERAVELAGRADVGLAHLAGGGLGAVLGEGELRDALADIADGLRADVEVTVEIGATAPSVLTTAYFVVSEALANVAKHADAKHVVVRVTRSGSDVVVDVVDDGVGGADSLGFGLRSLAARLAEAGGELRVASRQDGGTALHAVIRS